MSGQERTTPQERPDGDADEAAPPPQGQSQVSGDDVDAILDEIDDVLEENAEDFVRAYVQKGGQ